MRQTWAMFVDAYRELNAKKLFWVTMLISGLVVGAFACVSTTPSGLKILVWDLELPFFNSAILPNATFYKLMFQTLGIEVWLTWAATIIGLIATCSMIPDFVAGGSVELALSKPISRARLFLTKYAAGLLFTLLQVTVFSVAAFLLIGIRGGEWQPRILLAVPIVTLSYSYLFCVCALVGLLTRSTIFALIAVMVFWLGIFAADTVERGVLLSMRVQSEQRVQRLEERLEKIENPSKADVAAEKAKQESKGILERAADAFRTKPVTESAAIIKGELVVARKREASFAKWHNVAWTVKALLPKTSETTNLLAKHLLPESELSKFRDAQVQQAEENQRQFREMQQERERERAAKAGRPVQEPGEVGDDDLGEFGPGLAREIERRINERGLWWSVGTSMLFQALVLGIACWVFSRRDF
ncbi:MAG: ABC transporter permease [Phycisphaerales bacterium]